MKFKTLTIAMFVLSSELVLANNDYLNIGLMSSSDIDEY